MIACPWKLEEWEDDHPEEGPDPGHPLRVESEIEGWDGAVCGACGGPIAFGPDGEWGRDYARWDGGGGGPSPKGRHAVPH